MSYFKTNVIVFPLLKVQHVLIYIGNIFKKWMSKNVNNWEGKDTAVYDLLFNLLSWLLMSKDFYLPIIVYGL